MNQVNVVASCMIETEIPHTSTRAQTELSELIIPSVPGEYYVYSSEFTVERPVYALIKCKESKNRPISAVVDLGREANLFFRFVGSDQAEVFPIHSAYTAGLLGNSVDGESLSKTYIASLEIDADVFYKLCSQRKIRDLVEIVHFADTEHDAPIKLTSGSVIAIMTYSGKYGMFYVKEITQTSILIDACHVLL